MSFVKFIVVTVLIGLVSRCNAKVCGGNYESCNLGDPTKLNVHLVPHTHDDVGWLKTVDQYYYGANDSIQHAGVQYILDTVVPHLLENPSRRFIYVEIAFFERWWKLQDEDMRNTVRDLVAEDYLDVQKAGVQYIVDTVIDSLDRNTQRKFIYVEIAYFKRWWDEQESQTKMKVQEMVDQGRLEFILGGWCMNDEAATHYNAIIDQMSLGLRFLNDTFGACARPRVAWQIDPFGHSREQASIFAQMGFDGLFFGRLDYDDKVLRSKEKRMEEIWRGSESLDKPLADLMTGVNENGYGPPKGFCFDEYCADDPIMDDPNLEEYNVDDKVKFFEDAARAQANHFKTNHIMMTMGSDFQYSNAHKWYKNLDKLVKYVNSAKDSNISVFYSTPSCYLYALNQADQQWTVKHDDFFPYADGPNHYWTGYFTSRPSFKGYVRETNKVLQVCNQLEVLGKNAGSKELKSPGMTSEKLREAMGVAQHHDAVSGTEKQHVANDYAKRLYKGREVCKAIISNAITGSVDEMHFCDYLNISYCKFTEDTQKFSVVVYNPLARGVSTYVRLPVMDNGGSFSVIDTNTMKATIAQIVPIGLSTLLVRKDRGHANSELIFKADVPALGYAEYMVTKSNYSSPLFAMSNHRTVRKKVKSTDVTISNEFYKVVFDGTSGLMKTVANLVSGISLPTTQRILWYNASTGNNVSEQKSGAYIFRPNSSTPFTCTQNGLVELTVLEGDTPLVQEFYQKFSDWAFQVVRLYSGMKYVEVEWTVGPIPFMDNYGKEVISRYDTPLMSKEEFYTDANGREVLKRKLNYRPTWKLNQSEPVAGNYFPVNSRIFLNDTQTQFTILTDRSQGGASLKNGSLELMIHRRLLVDDSRGVGEPLNETGQFGDGLITRGKHWLVLDTVEKSVAQHRLLAEQIYMSPLIGFYANSSLLHTKATGIARSALNYNLPPNVHLLTLSHETSDNSMLIRLEHQFQKNEDATYSRPVVVSLKDLFVNFEPISLEELTLGANAVKGEVTRLQWKTIEIGFQEKAENSFPPSTDPFDVSLLPMQIRTFRMMVKTRK